MRPGTGDGPDYASFLGDDSASAAEALGRARLAENEEWLGRGRTKRTSLARLPRVNLGRIGVFAKRVRVGNHFATAAEAAVHFSRSDARLSRAYARLDWATALRREWKEKFDAAWGWSESARILLAGDEARAEAFEDLSRCGARLRRVEAHEAFCAAAVQRAQGAHRLRHVGEGRRDSRTEHGRASGDSRNCFERGRDTREANRVDRLLQDLL